MRILEDLKKNASKEINILLEYYVEVRSDIKRLNKERDEVGQAYLEEEKKEKKSSLADKMIALTSNMFVMLKLADKLEVIALKWGFDLKSLFEEEEQC